MAVSKETNHRRRIKTEEKAKVVASVWVKEIIQFCVVLAILPRTLLKNEMNSSFSFKSSWCNSSHNSNRENSQRGKELNKFFPQKRSDNLCLCFCLYPSSMKLTHLHSLVNSLHLSVPWAKQSLLAMTVQSVVKPHVQVSVRAAFRCY